MKKIEKLLGSRDLEVGSYCYPVLDFVDKIMRESLRAL